MGSKDAPCEHPSPANDFRTRPVRVCTSAPAFTLSPSAFTLLPHRLPRPPQSNRHPAAAVIHNGLSTEKLSTSLPAALCKTFSPSRLRTRIIIYRSPVGRSRGVSAPLRKRVRAVVAPCSASPCAGWGRGRQRRTPPRAVLNHAACVPNHCVQRQSAQGKPRPCPCAPPAATCLRPRPRPLVCRITVRKGGSAQGQPRPCPCVLPAATYLPPHPRPLVCRITVRKGGSAQGQPRPCPCVLPAATCLPPRSRPLMGEAPSAGWGRTKAKADAPLHSNPPLSAYRRAPAA